MGGRGREGGEEGKEGRKRGGAREGNDVLKEEE